MLLKYATVRNVKYPERGHATDAGIDFRCPKIDDSFVEDLLSKDANRNIEIRGGSILIPQGENATIPTGIKVEIPYGYMGLFLNKSGVASKNDVLIGAQVIDTFYSGEVHIDLHNVGNNMFVVSEDMKLAQMVVTPILSCDLTLCDEDALYDWMKSDETRGEGGFGSTGV